MYNFDNSRQFLFYIYLYLDIIKLELQGGVALISILLADDHCIVRTGIKYLINSNQDMKVVGEARDGEEAVQKALKIKPDIVIMDLSMPKKNGMLALKQISESNSEIKIIVLTMHEEKEYIFRVLQAGASSYLLKSHQENHLIDAIRVVNRGEAYLYTNDTKILLEDYLNRTNRMVTKIRELTGREQEVLSYLAKGYTNKEVAESLFLSTKTIESHRANIMEKLNFKTRRELVDYAIRNGFLDV